ncbi:hypothetical protein [Frigidibacter sp. MR17.24]|uniref:hypothetical protein n=1 Tax=Frigidibacter sp. MR17.24 TaxID=3127345 RepID=UPI003012E75B
MARFQLRLARIEQAHAELASVEERLASPRSGRALRTIARSLAIIVMAVMVLKIAIVAHIGEAAYEARVAALRGGKSIDRTGAIVLALDPVSRGAARLIAGRRN